MINIYASPIFKDVPEHVVDKILERKYKLLQFRAGALIAMQGQTYRTLYIIDEGKVRGEMTNEEGVNVIIEEIEAPRVIAPAFFFSTENRLPVDIYAVTDVTLVAISKDHFLDLLHNNRQVLINTIRSISDRNQFLSERIRLLRFGTIKSKLSAFLIEQMHLHGVTDFTIAQTQQELADLFGVTRPSLARALRQLEESGAIERHGTRRYIIKSPLSGIIPGGGKSKY